MGGAERQCLLTAKHLSVSHDVTILTFYDPEAADYQIDRNEFSNFRVVSLAKSGRWDIFGLAWRYLKAIREADAEVVYAYLNTACLLSLLSRVSGPKVRLIWSLRSSQLQLNDYNFTESVIRRLECWCSVFADAVISNSWDGKFRALERGYRNELIKVIPNGIDTDKFIFSSASRRALRKQMQIPEDQLVIGVVARHDPMKGIEVMLRAYADVSVILKKSLLVIIGKEQHGYTEGLKELSNALGISQRVLWLPAKKDIKEYYSVIDVYISPSVYGEGFSNSVGEAMSCGLPCVVTDVGDSARIVANLGQVVAPGSESELRNAIIARGKRYLVRSKDISRQRRERIKGNFSIQKMVSSTEKILCQER